MLLADHFHVRVNCPGDDLQAQPEVVAGPELVDEPTDTGLLLADRELVTGHHRGRAPHVAGLRDRLFQPAVLSDIVAIGDGVRVG